MGMAKLRSPRASKTPQRISVNLGIYNYVAGMTTHANLCGAAAIGGLGEHVTCHMLSLFSLFFFLSYSWVGAQQASVYSIYTSREVFLRKEVPIVGRNETTSIQGSNAPKAPFLRRKYAFSSLTRKILKHAYYRN